MAFVKLTDLNGQPLLLKFELIESVREYVIGRLYSLGNVVEEKEYATEIKLTNGNEYNVKETVEEVEKVLEGLNDI